MCFFHYIIGASWSNDVIFHQIPQLLMSYKWQNISSWHSHESYSCSLLCKSQMQQEGIKCLKVFSQMQHECHQDTQFFLIFFFVKHNFPKVLFSFLQHPSRESNIPLTGVSWCPQRHEHICGTSKEDRLAFMFLTTPHSHLLLRISSLFRMYD